MAQILIMTLILILFPVMITAESMEEDQISEQSIRLDEIVVTATRTERSEMEVPTNLMVITKDDIEKYQPTDITDLLRHVPGLT